MSKSTIPHIFTLGNLCCGILSLLMTLQGNYKTACTFILLAALLDRYDGRIARYLNVFSSLGKELDSLADLISFGVAPSILLFNIYTFLEFGFIGYILVLIFPICGAYRLARYNVTSFNGVFSGVPITVAGSILAIYSFLTLNKTQNKVIPVILLLILSYLMVSKTSFKKL
ncbi:CDP-diacylglycerol--serine O-phosphatidyltransferase [Clostridium rectalis]|uniref:CDP-diacylglycerol--serine O-phosphatidyltransferase n=1 Tax=Clostridium rectalis TaxID=2040295 RepID=UPI000F6424A7|nr:CDP-diacylglycerol--serine O-phosphatidyltransferase [Clostridium rectalis]